MEDVCKVGLLGFGTVGSSLVELLSDRQSSLEAMTGLKIELSHIAVRDKSKYDFSKFSDGVTISDVAQKLVRDPKVDVVVELIGGLEPARSLVLSALRSGKPVVTGNKALIANHGAELFAAAKASKVDLLFEASTAGAIPILRPLRESLLGEDVRRIMGIVNGTTNFILSQMTDSGATYSDSLAQAQELGFAEADPTADVDGHDSAAKAAIMASLAFGVEVKADDVATEGISKVTAFDIATADRLGYSIKLLAVAEKKDHDVENQVAVHVAPALVPHEHPLTSVKGSYNAVFVEGAASAELMFYGRGAGGKPTASAVLGDLVDACRNLQSGNHKAVPSGEPAKIFDPANGESEYYIVIETQDSPGVLSDVAGLFAKHNVSIKTIEQETMEAESKTATPAARIVFITQQGLESDFVSLFAELTNLDSVNSVENTIRVVV